MVAVIESSERGLKGFPGNKCVVRRIKIVHSSINVSIEGNFGLYNWPHEIIQIRCSSRSHYELIINSV